MSEGKYVGYVGTYTHENSVGIHIYDMDIEHGKMHERKVVPINNPSYLAFSTNRKFLYSIADEGVRGYRILPDGDLEEINSMWIGGMRGCYIEIDKNDEYLYVAGYHDGRVSMMKLNPETGEIVALCDGVFHKGMGRCIAQRSSRPHVNCVRLTPEGDYLMAADGGLDHIKIYKIDKRLGKLRNHDILRTQLDSAPKSLRFSADGKYLYVLCELLNCVNVYRYYMTDDGPEFEFLQEITTTDPKDDDICSAVAMDIAPSGTHLFVVNAGVNSAVIYNIDKETGLLSLMCNSRISGEFPKGVRVMPNEEHFVTLNHENNEIVMFKINYEGGYFLLESKPIPVDKPNCIKVHTIQS